MLVSILCQTRASIEVDHFFSGIPRVGSLRQLPKTDFDKTKASPE